MIQGNNVFSVHAMYTYKENGNGGMAPLILNHCFRWRLVVNFTPRLISPLGKRSGTHSVKGWADPRPCLDVSEQYVKYVSKIQRF